MKIMISPISLLILGGLAFFLYMTGKKGAVILALLITGLCLLIYFKQNALLYMPVIPGSPKSPSENPFKMRHPRQHNLQSTDLNLVTKDGVNIKGWHVHSQNSNRILIYFHENAGNIGTRVYYVRQLSRRLNCDVILVAYRGYSDSDSVPTEEGLKLDSYAIMEYAREYSKKTGLPLYIIGRSLGGAVTVNLAEKQQYKKDIKGVILQNTFTCISEMIDALMPFLSYFKFLQRNFWPSIQLIQKIDCPILFVKSMKDEIVPVEHMHALMEKAKAPKREYRIADGTHNNSWGTDPDEYFDQLKRWMGDVENGRVKKGDIDIKISEAAALNEDL